MKIALLSPAGAMHRYSGSFKRALHYAPLTLTTLAALVPQELEIDIKIYDETAGQIPLDLEADLIGITAITGTSMRAYRYADYFRSKGITVVLGGVHPTMLPEEAAQHADSVVVGLADDSWPQLIRDFVAKKLKKFYYQEEGITLAGRPEPRRDLLNPKRYITMNSVEAIRGCALPCTFCAYPAAFGRHIYKRPINELIAEIEKLPGREVLFPDVNLLADYDYARQLFTEMAPLKKMWFGLVTSSIGIDQNMIDLFEKSGCKGLLIGFESMSQDSQAYIKKGVNKVEEYEDLMKRLHNAGIAVNGCFAFGGDQDDKSVFEKTVELVIKLQIDLPRYSILTPFPRTQLYSDLAAQHRIIEKNWAMYDVEHCVFQPAQMTPTELEQGIEWAWRETYKFKSITSRLKHFKTYFWVSLITNLAYRTYADKFHKFSREVMVNNSDIPEIVQGGEPSLCT